MDMKWEAHQREIVNIGKDSNMTAVYDYTFLGVPHILPLHQVEDAWFQVNDAMPPAEPMGVSANALSEQALLSFELTGP